MPDSLVPLAKKVAEEVKRPPRREIGRRVRDVLMQFDDSFEPPRYSLYGFYCMDAAGRSEWPPRVLVALP